LLLGLPAPAIGTQAAIAAVDEATKKLPDEAGVKFSFQPEGAGPAQSEPPNLNNKVRCTHRTVSAVSCKLIVIESRASCTGT